MDVANCIADVWYRLGFTSSGDLGAGSWVTPTELYQFADEAGKRLAREAGAFVTVDNSIAVTAGTAEYTLPASHVFSMQVVLGQ